jgi:hypothetical protein
MAFSAFTYQMSIWSIIIPLMAGVFFYKKLDRDSKIIFYLVVLAASPQIITAFILSSSPVRNIFYNVYTPVEFVLTYLFVGKKIQNISFRNICRFVVVLFIILSVALVYRYGLSHRFLNEWVCAANISYLCWIFLFILESLLQERRLLNTSLPLFWYISALLIYTPCTIFVFALSFYITGSKNPFISNLWIIHEIFNTLLYILFAIGLYKNRSYNYSLNTRKFIAS